MKKKDIERKKGTLLTFRNAGRDALEFIPAAAFDDAIAHLKLDMIISTRMQNHKFTRVQTGNRYCVVETPADLKSIPESIPVVESNTKKSIQVTIEFWGQEKYCNVCNQMEIGRCPVKEERKKKMEQREAMKEAKGFSTKLYSDSTLRSVGIIGLKADVQCMSGGGLGQIIQSAIDDPDDHYDKIVILGGTNDSKSFLERKLSYHIRLLSQYRLGVCEVNYLREGKTREEFLPNSTDTHKGRVSQTSLRGYCSRDIPQQTDEGYRGSNSKYRDFQYTL